MPRPIPKYQPGDRFKLTAEAIKNYGQRYEFRIFTVRQFYDHTGHEGTGLPTFEDSARACCYAAAGFPFVLYEWEIEPTTEQPTQPAEPRRPPGKPEPVRNFWIEAEIDSPRGKQILSGGPAAKDGGFKLTIKMRDQGENRAAFHVQGDADTDGQLHLHVFSADGEQVYFYHHAQRDQPAPPVKKKARRAS